jgi:rhodanese-related sulfurtransferase
MSNFKDVTPAAALALIRKGALLVDVREPNEIARKSFDVPNIMQIPLSRIESRYQEIPANSQVIVACARGNRSLVAARFLTSHGYRKVINMQQGIARWEREGLPLNTRQQQNFFSWLKQKLGGKS